MTADVIDIATKRPPPEDPGDTPITPQHLPAAPSAAGPRVAITETTWQALVGALAAVPSLPGAKCAGRWDLFDVTDSEDERAEAATHLCNTCPALTKCRTWFDGLPPGRRPIGVVAGRVVKDTTEPKPVTDTSKWLTDYLTERGPSRALDVAAAAADAGISERGLRGARNRIGVTIRRPSQGVPSVWSLPKTEGNTNV
ncbi:hypothetical protein [Mycobacterium sp. 1245801.1]|uniref:hypothetical protein n=1 Tax=Mycobacterium sp. 1245801.1 TaxID=1834075 RepID=UPI0007FCA8E2|nr:hypothetical protein [Mycobacterium sp. 1245801.1]OBJ24619.1 hypothetical protein A5622_11625 [Mycobacterium sp. 1245801.1]